MLELHRRLGGPVVYDHHHHRCNRARAFADPHAALAAAYATWPTGVWPKAHLSSPRTELRETARGPRPPRLDSHADFATPWDAAELLRAAPGPLDVMVEAKAKDLAVLWLRRQLERVEPELAAAEACRGAGARGPGGPADRARGPRRSLVSAR